MRPGEFIWKAQPQPTTTAAATPSKACWPPSPPTPWSGTSGSWSQVENTEILTIESPCRVVLERQCSLQQRRSSQACE